MCDKISAMGFRVQRTPRGLESSWRSCFAHRCPSSLLVPLLPPCARIQGESGNGVHESGLRAQWCKSKKVPGQGRELRTPKAKKHKPIRFPTHEESKRWQRLTAQSPSTAGKWPENLTGRNLIETVRKVKAEELITPTGPDKGQRELSSCSIWCQRPWLLSSTPRQFRPP